MSGQTGSGGYGISHGYGEGDSPDHDNSHEFKGHGVSAEWIKSKVTSAVHNMPSTNKKTGQSYTDRVSGFQKKLESRADGSGKGSDKAHVARVAARTAKESRVNITRAKGESGWAAWKAKGGGKKK